MAKKMGDKMSAFWTQEQQAPGIREQEKTPQDHIFGLLFVNFAGPRMSVTEPACQLRSHR
jgi:hypothetical protein